MGIMNKKQYEAIFKACDYALAHYERKINEKASPKFKTLKKNLWMAYTKLTIAYDNSRNDDLANQIYDKVVAGSIKVDS